MLLVFSHKVKELIDIRRINMTIYLESLQKFLFGEIARQEPFSQNTFPFTLGPPNISLQNIITV